MNYLLIIILIGLSSLLLQGQINRNHHTSYNEHIIQSLKLEDGKMLLLFSEERHTYCPWPTLALFDSTGEMIWKNKLETFPLEINFFSDKTTFFSFNPTTQQIFIASTDVECCTDVPGAPRDVIAFIINVETGEKIINFAFENLYSFESTYENINRTVRINAETFIIANSNSSLEGTSVFSLNPLTSEGTLLKEIPNETITFIYPVDDETFIFNTSNKVYKMNISGIMEDSLILAENLELRQLYPNKIEILNNNRYLIIDGNLNVIEDYLLGDASLRLKDVILSGEWAYSLAYTGNTIDDLDEVRLFRRNLNTLEETETVFAPENFQPDRILIDNDKIRMFGREHHGKSFGLSIIDVDTQTLNYEILQGKDIALTDVGFEIINLAPRNGIPHFDVTYNINVKVQNLGSSVDSFKVSFHSFGMLLFYNSLCGNNGISTTINLPLETGETSEFILLGTKSMTSIPAAPNQFSIYGCAWVSAPDGKTDDVAENDMICKTEIVTSVESLLFSQINIYPNPSNSSFFINLSENFQGTGKVFNYTGQLVSEFRITDRTHILNLSDHAKGMYFIQLNDNKKQESKTFKVILQ